MVVKWAKRVVGEISKLRNKVTAFGGKSHSVYTLDSSRVDYALARSLYRNTDDRYKLGAGFAKPVINTLSAFTGIPDFKNDDPEITKYLNDFTNKNISSMSMTNITALRDGDCFVWLTIDEHDELYEDHETNIKYNMVPAEQVQDIIRDPFTGEVKEYVLISNQEWTEDDIKKKAKITQRINKYTRKITIEGDRPSGEYELEERNPWGFIPIVHFKNECDPFELFGRSELEPIEPFMKAYHDVLLHAIQGSKNHSTPKLKLKLTDVAAFLANNFGVDDPERFIAEGKSINLEGHELLMLQDNEEAGYVEVKSAIGDAVALLKFLFYAIVDTSEVPEFAFGVHTPSSLSSVKEQMPILLRRIDRKREQFHDAWHSIARMVLVMLSKSQGKNFKSYSVELVWEKIDPRDEKEVAEELNLITQSLERALKNNMISLEATVDFLGRYIDTMYKYDSGDKATIDEKERIMKTMLMKMRLEDAQFLDSQKQQIDEELKKL